MEQENKKLININLRYPLNRLPRKTKKKVVALLETSQFGDVPKKKRYRFWLYSIRRKFGLIDKKGRPLIIVEKKAPTKK